MNLLPLKSSSDGTRFVGLVDGGGLFVVSLNHKPSVFKKKGVSFSLVMLQSQAIILEPFIERIGGQIRKNEKEGIFK